MFAIKTFEVLKIRSPDVIRMTGFSDKSNADSGHYRQTLISDISVSEFINAFFLFMRRNLIVFSALITLTALLLFLIFKPVILNPNSYVFSKAADGLKSYYNFSYYLKYDEGIRFDGINYPYGDHLQYINSHPLYSQILKFADKHIYNISPYGVGILNLTMIFSLLLAIPFLFLILRKFGLPDWYAFPVSLIILFLSPQLDRLGGHFEMVYAFFIPLYWYLLIRWREGEKKYLWGTLMIFTALVGGFTSAYYAAFFAIFPLALLLVESWNHKDNLKSYSRTGIGLLIIAILPVIIVKGLVSVTDWVDDRPGNPWGFFVFHSNIWSIFLPFRSVLKELIGQKVNMNFQWEGRAYVGLPAALLALSIAFAFLWNLIRRKKPDMKLFFPDRQLNVYLATAFIVLLFSMCIPFKWGLGFLRDIIPPLKQFRALGRFSWIFYYVFTVFTAHYIYFLFRRLRRKSLGIMGLLILLIGTGYWIIDAGTNIKRSTGHIFNKNDKLESSDDEYKTRFEKAGISPDDFQAIFFLPFANTSGDKLYFERGLNAFGEAMKFSYHTQIPIVESFSPRLSFSQALSSIQLLGDSAIYKTRVDDMNDKPLLLVVTKEKLSKSEKWLFDRSIVRYEDDDLYLAGLSVNTFNNAHENWLKYVKDITDSLDCTGNICTDTEAENIFYNGFEESHAENVFTGKGARYGKKGEMELFNKVLFAPGQPDDLEISFWLYFDERIFSMPEAFLNMYDNNQKFMERIKIDTRGIHDVFENWVRISYQLKPRSGIHYQLLLKGKYVTVDDLLIRPEYANTRIITRSKFDLFNNFPVVY